MKIVGIAGLPRSGKDTVAEVFMSAGYYGFSFGDYNREYSRKRHADKPDPISVANMTETSNWLRETYGPDVILRAALDKFEQAKKDHPYKGLVLFSVRAPVEVDWTLNHGGELLWVETSDEVRHKRALANMRQGEQETSLEEFRRQEGLQWHPQPGIPRESQMDIEYVKKHATKTVVNNGSNLREFRQSLDDLI